MIPELRILSYVLLVVSVYLVADMRFYLAVGILMVFFLASIPRKRLAAGWLPILMLSGFTLAANIFHQPGRILVSLGALTITEQGLAVATLRTLRLLLLIAGVKLLIGGVRPEDLVRGLQTLCRPAERIGLPVRDFFHVMGLTIACFPLLRDMVRERYRSTVSVQKIRGVSARIAAIGAFLLPLFAESLLSPDAYFEEHDRSGHSL
ncbi:MAG: hypothetical protein OHK006_00380 [Thermodesulfovibrionales bacterium]